jgi:hypothetical protein
MLGGRIFRATLPMPSPYAMATTGQPPPLHKDKLMISGFAVFPDGSANPAAVFDDLEDAMDWALTRFGDDSFRIRHLSLANVEREPDPNDARS